MINRRSFLQRAALSTAALASPAAPSLIRAAGMPKAETLVKTLYDSLS